MLSIDSTTASPLQEQAAGILDKDDPKKLATLTAIGPLFLVLFSLWTFYFMRKDKFREGSYSYLILAAFTFCVTSVSMNTLNKAAVSFTHQPSLVTSIQMGVAVVVLMAWHGREVMAANRKQLLSWCIVPVCYAAMLNTSLLGYEYISLTLMTVFRNLAPFVTMTVEGVIMPPEHRPTVTKPVVAAMSLMVLGAILFTDGEGVISWIGVGLVLLNTLLAITDRVIQRRLLVAECKDLPLSACMVINNTLGTMPTLMLAYASKEFQTFSQSGSNWKDPGVLVLVFMSGLMGLFIGMAGLMCQKAMSATSFQVLQNLSKLFVVFMGVFVFGEHMDNRMKIAGMFLSLAGSFGYGYARAQENAVKQKAEEALPLVQNDKAGKA